MIYRFESILRCGCIIFDWRIFILVAGGYYCDCIYFIKMARLGFWRCGLFYIIERWLVIAVRFHENIFSILSLTYRN